MTTQRPDEGQETYQKVKAVSQTDEPRGELLLDTTPEELAELKRRIEADSPSIPLEQAKEIIAGRLADFRRAE